MDRATRRDTLVFLLDKEAGRILLAMKKRGFGQGKLNGVGGKAQEGESLEEAAVRETREEIGVDLKEEDLRKVAELDFSFEEKPEWSINCHVYTAERWEGEPAESEEMTPQWFGMREIPLRRMWIDDELWLPRVLGGEYVEAEFQFNSDGTAILYHNVRGRAHG